MLSALRRHGTTVVVALSTAVVVGGLPATAHISSVGHTWNKHFQNRADARYYQKIKLNTDDGTVNQAGDPVQWTKLKGVPADFADGTDATGGTTDVVCVGCVDTVDLADGAVTADKVSGAIALDDDIFPNVLSNDGPGSTLNADLLDGQSSADFAGVVHTHSGGDITSGTVAEARIHADIARDSEIFSTVLANDGTGSTLDADTVDGQSSAAFAGAVHAHSGGDITSGTVAEARIDSDIARDSEIFSTVLANDGTGSTLDADTVDGQSSAAFAAAAHNHDTAYYTQTQLNTSDGDDPNTGSNRIHWNNLNGVPAGFVDGTDDTGAPGWDLAGNGGTDPSTNFIGTTDNLALNFRVNNTRALSLEPNATSPNVIGGYLGNSVTPGAAGAAIGGGGASTFLNRVTDDYGTVGGGRNNRAGDDTGTTSDRASATVGGGTSNTASGTQATVGGGSGNVASATQATVAGGASNTASVDRATIGGGSNNAASGSLATIGGGEQNQVTASYATVGGGLENQATAPYGTIAGGAPTNLGDAANTRNIVTDEYGAVGGGGNNQAGDNAGTTADRTYATVAGGRDNTASGSFSSIPGGSAGAASLYGQLAHASGQFAAAGDAQTSEYVLRRTSTGNTSVELFLDGVDDQLTIPSGHTYFFRTLIVGRSDAGNSGGYAITGLIENVGGTTALVGAPFVLALEDVTQWGATVSADDTNNALAVTANGFNTDANIRWVAMVETAEVAF